MDYNEARKYLEEAAKSGIILGLESIRNLLHELDNPQDDLKFIHIAGTNGKGSVLAFTSTILETAGYKVGRYISPTVQSYRERIQVNRQNISKTDFTSGISQIKAVIDRMLAKGLPHPSVFEIETVLGFLQFKQQACDIVVMETGMGGVLDATNIIKNTLVAIITSVSRDHTEFLGDTIADLTHAKVGIIKPGCTIIHGELPQEALGIIEHFANERRVINKNDIILQKNQHKYIQLFTYQNMKNIKIKLLGHHQIKNATLAIAAVQSLTNHNFHITDDQIKEGLAATEWFGRITILKEENPVIIVDGAHNQEAAQALASTLRELFPAKKIVGIMGVFKDKEVAEMLFAVKGVISEIHTITLADKLRSLTATELATRVKNAGIKSFVHRSLADAINKTIHVSEVIVVFGSLSHLGEVAKLL